MSKKNYSVHFFQVESFTIQPDQVVNRIWDLLVQEKVRNDSGLSPSISRSPSGYSFELREIKIFNSVITGCLALLGSDAPHIRDANGSERMIQTNPGDQFLQKNYFLYFKEKRLLVWQFNLSANHVNNFGIMLTSLTANTDTIVCNSLLDDAFGFDPKTAAIQYVDLRVRAPKTVAQREQVKQLNPNEWAIDPFESMSKTNSSTFSLTLQTRGANKSLSKSVSNMIDRLWGSDQTRKLRVKLSDAEEPIDLLAKRIKRKMSVEMLGIYPDPRSVIEQLQAAKDECNEEINRNI